MAPQPRRRPARTLRHHLVQAAGMTIIGALVAMALLPGSVDIADVTGGDGAVARSQVQTPADAHLAALMGRYRCSTEGFGHSAIPESAIIRRPDGHVRAVSFDRGWQVFQDHGPTSLVAVCLRPPA
jgi:hypothetical protein